MRAIAVTSGKGGVGKTNVSANLAIGLAQLGRRVVLIDGDIGLANIDVILGVQPVHRLQAVVQGRVTLRQALIPGPGGIRFLGGGSGAECLLNLSGNDADHFLSQLSELAAETDDLIIDTGAGLGENVMVFVDSSDTVLVVATQDPASMADAYAITKVCLTTQKNTDIRLIVNMADSEAAAKVIHERFSAVSKQFLGRSIPMAGHVRTDPKAVASIRGRKPYLVNEPHCMASADIMNIARRLVGVSVTENQGIVQRLRMLFYSSKSLAG